MRSLEHLNRVSPSSGGTTSLVSPSSPTTCKPVSSFAIPSTPTFTAQYCGLIFRSFGEQGSIKGWHILRSKVLRLRKNPSCAWVVAKNSAIICGKKITLVQLTNGQVHTSTLYLLSHGLNCSLSVHTAKRFF